MVNANGCVLTNSSPLFSIYGWGLTKYFIYVKKKKNKNLNIQKLSENQQKE